jgi:ubiquinol-cytochrome c reductase cytochrome b subunit
MLKRLGGWVYDRLGLSTFHREVLDHEIPPEIGRTRKGWYYVFGQALVFAFLLQVITGTALATKYIPTPAHAWESLHFINRDVAWGAFVRGLHFFGASAMVVLVFVHMSRVFLTGSYKYPRELNWITGVVLLFLVLAMAFTGQLLRWDENGVWTVMVAAQFAGRVPFLGPHLMELILAGDTLGGATLSRFYALHVIVLPLLMIAVIGIHVYLVLYNGVSEPPKPGRPVEPATYRGWYKDMTKKGGSTYWPDAAWREFVFVILVLAVVFSLAWLFGPKGPGPAPDPTRAVADPRPDWFFLWYYALIWFKPRELDEAVLVWLPLSLGLALLLLPILFNRGERDPRKRPWAIMAVGFAFLFWAILTAFGLRPHWVPKFVTEPVSPAQLETAPPAVVQGAHAFYVRGCQYCHRGHGRGGFYGPDLTDTLRRMSREEATIRIVMGIRNMPAYREILTREELERILAYLAWAAEAEG